MCSARGELGGATARRGQDCGLGCSGRMPPREAVSSPGKSFCVEAWWDGNVLEANGLCVLPEPWPPFPVARWRLEVWSCFSSPTSQKQFTRCLPSRPGRAFDFGERLCPGPRAGGSRTWAAVEGNSCSLGPAKFMVKSPPLPALAPVSATVRSLVLHARDPGRWLRRSAAPGSWCLLVERLGALEPRSEAPASREAWGALRTSPGHPWPLPGQPRIRLNCCCEGTLATT